MKKGDTTKASILVNSPFTLEELVHMIDVSVNRKYGANLEGITGTIINSMQGVVESLRQDFKQEHESVSWYIRATVQQVLDDVRDKRGLDMPGTSVAATDLDTGNKQGMPVNPSVTVSQRGAVNPNLQQPFYQAHAYGPEASQLVPDAFFPRSPIFPMVTGNAHPGMFENVRDQVT
jgi:hypothetical protein